MFTPHRAAPKTGSWVSRAVIIGSWYTGSLALAVTLATMNNQSMDDRHEVGQMTQGFHDGIKAFYRGCGLIRGYLPAHHHLDERRFCVQWRQSQATPKFRPKPEICKAQRTSITRCRHFWTLASVALSVLLPLLRHTLLLGSSALLNIHSALLRLLRRRSLLGGFSLLFGGPALHPLNLLQPDEILLNLRMHISKSDQNQTIRNGGTCPPVPGS